MRIYTHFQNKLPKGEHVVEWKTQTENCDEHVYGIRTRQNMQPETNWFRNLKLLQTFQVPNPHYPGAHYTIYNVQYERKEEYYVADVPSAALTQILKNDPDLGVIFRDGKLWLDYVGD